MEKMNIMNQLKIYRIHPEIEIPKFGTAQSACFDIAFNPAGKFTYDGFDRCNAPFYRNFGRDRDIKIMPFDRILVPTGLIFDIPEGHSVRIHSRSGLSLKKGLVLANMEAVIDSDYTQETFLMLLNISDNPHYIAPGDRLAQAELVQSLPYELVDTTDAPTQKTDRVGGLGSTGVSSKKKKETT